MPIRKPLLLAVLPLLLGAQPSAPLKNMVLITTDGTYRHITSNGIPDHAPGNFPNRYNPGTIAAQSYKFRVPLRPTTAPSPISTRHDLFGVAVNGVPFDPATAEFYRDDRRSIWNMEAIGTKDAPAVRNLGLDHASAHVQPGGVYHYHALPLPLLKSLGGGDGSRMTLLGYAADGYPIYAPFGPTDANNPKSEIKELRSSYRLKKGARPTDPATPPGNYDGRYTPDYEYVEGAGDLDESNGRTGVTPEYPGGTYYYVLTADFPFIPRSWHATPDPSFMKPRPGPRNTPGGPDRPRRPGPPPPR